MRVKVAGHNIDIESLKEKRDPSAETLPAGYARISRDPRDVTELREDARKEIEKARRSNQTIVFGMGHHSIAEHANLNFDILDISRLALEELEARRIGSAYTEKSQRYITLEGDYYLPKEFDSKDKEKFEDLIKTQNDFYFKSLDKLIEYQYKENPELARKARIAEEKGTSNLMNRAKNAIEGWAKEDARYALSLATEGQVGVTFNARTLEHAIRSMRNSELSETKELSEKLFDEAKEVVPSLIRLANAEEYKKEYGRELEDDNYKYTREEIKGLVESDFILAAKIDKIKL